MDRIELEGLAVDAPIGVYAHEHGVLQRLVIDVVVETDVRAAAASDRIDAAIDYDGIAKICRETATERHHQLIETVAEQIAERVLKAEAAKVTAVEVRVAKPGAVPDARTVACRVRRTWKSG